MAKREPAVYILIYHHRIERCPRVCSLYEGCDARDLLSVGRSAVSIGWLGEGEKEGWPCDGFLKVSRLAGRDGVIGVL